MREETWGFPCNAENSNYDLEDQIEVRKSNFTNAYPQALQGDLLSQILNSFC